MRAKMRKLKATKPLRRTKHPMPASRHAGGNFLKSQGTTRSTALSAGLTGKEVTISEPARITIAPESAPPPERERTSYDADTAIKLYLREIGQVKLLTPQEEIALAARIKKGDKKAREHMI